MMRWWVGAVFFLAGVTALGGVNAFFEYTNTTDFCTSCHTMQWNKEEWMETLHFRNRVGVRAECADCHVPKEFFPKVMAKILAVKDLYHHLAGTIDTKEQFEIHRWAMANRVWEKMKRSDSRECRTCHEYEDMDLSQQSRSAQRRHEKAPLEGKTCIDCHKGVAHRMPEEPKT
ncbi:MAG: NapC/NirT family cytochrome c [Hydrogenophilus sp.]|nr:NapC/NirT family cytochrome c [Hydrogenophilus sp.]